MVGYLGFTGRLASRAPGRTGRTALTDRGPTARRPRGLGCETISILGFTGVLPFDVIRDEADRTLRDLRATGINTQDVALPPVPGTIALRSSGYFNTAGLQVWAQHSTYVANYDKGRGLLILHGLFIESRSLERLRDNIIALSDAVHHAFLTAIAG